MTENQEIDPMVKRIVDAHRALDEEPYITGLEATPEHAQEVHEGLSKRCNVDMKQLLGYTTWRVDAVEEEQGVKFTVDEKALMGSLFMEGILVGLEAQRLTYDGE